MSPDSTQAQSLPERMFAAGIVDVIPVIPPGAPLSSKSKVLPSALGKIPGRKNANGLWGSFNWRTYDATLDDVREWVKDDANTGLRTTRFPAVDIDCKDATLAQRIEDSALAALGSAPVRTGNPPKRLLLYRTDEPFGRMRLWIAKGDETHLVEVLGEGQQAVVAGTHPCGRPYEWRGEPTVLAAITAAQATAFLDALHADLERDGYAVKREGDGKRPTHTAASDQATLRAPSLDALQECVAAIPNHDVQFPGRTDYLRVGYAIKAAAGPEHETEGCDLFVDWAARWDAGITPPEQAREDYRRMTGPASVGWSYLSELARDHGFNAAAYDFALVEGTPRPFAHRLASLCGVDRAVAFMELTADDDKQAELAKLFAAAEVPDPLADSFRRVRSMAYQYRGIAAERSLFMALVADKAERTLVTHSPEDQRLLLTAAWACYAPVGQAVAAQPGPFLSRTDVQREWLLDGLIGRCSVSALIGPGGVGKSWLAQLLARLIGRGDPATLTVFANHEVAAGSVVYCAGEDAEGQRERWARDEAVNGKVPNAHIVATVPPLSDMASTIRYFRDLNQRLHDQGAPPLVAVIIDPFRFAFAGDENSSTDVAAAMRTAHLVAQLFNVAIIFIQHTPRADSTRARGTGAFEWALDFMAVVSSPKPGEIIWSVERNKSGPRGERAAWRLHNGLLEPTAALPSAATDATKKLTKIEQRAYAIASVVRERAHPKQPVTRVVLKDDLPQRFPTLYGPDSGRKDAFHDLNREIKEACDLGLIREVKNGYEPVEPDLPLLSERPADLSDVSQEAA